MTHREWKNAAAVGAGCTASHQTWRCLRRAVNNERRLIVLMQIFKAEFLLPRCEIIKISRCFNEVPESLVYPQCKMMPISEVSP